MTPQLFVAITQFELAAVSHNLRVALSSVNINTTRVSPYDFMFEQMCHLTFFVRGDAMGCPTRAGDMRGDDRKGI